MPIYKHGARPTAGVLAGWQAYEGTIPTSYLKPLLEGIYAAACDRGCNLLFACGVYHDPSVHHPAWPVFSAEADFVPVGPWNTDGLIVVTALLSEVRSRYIQQLVADGHPVVFVGSGETGPTIVVDNESGIRQALSHLIAHGHRQIAFIAGREADPGESLHRLNAYRAVVKEYDLTHDDRLIAYGHYNRFDGQQAMQRILETGVPFTAVLASNDESAKGAIQALQAAGRRIPHDVAVIGFDDQADAKSQEPPLTTVHQPIFEIGYRALEALLTEIAGPQNPDNLICCQPRLVIRRSCGCTATPLHPQRVSNSLVGTEETSSARLVPQALVQLVSEAVLAEVHQLNSDEVGALCQRLVQALAASLDEASPQAFQSVLAEILQRIKALDEDAYAWQAAISALRQFFLPTLQTDSLSTNYRLAEGLLDQARVEINECGRWQSARSLNRQASMIDQLGLMTTRLLSALDEAQILSVLAEWLPRIGVQSGQVFFFEAQEDDPVAWSALHAQAGSPSGATLERFPSRNFPPPGFYTESVPFRLALLPLMIQDHLSGFVAFDASNLEPCAAIVRQLASALRSAQLYEAAAQGQRLAEEANRMKSRFLSTVSHELRTPLNLIVGLSEVLLQAKNQSQSRRSANDQRQADLERIHASAQHVSYLIRDVLDLASSEAGQLRLELEPLDLAEVFQVVSVTGEQMARDKGLAWRVNLPKDLPRVLGDRTRLRQVALNLVSNAVKFTEKGEIRLAVEMIKEEGRRKKEVEINPASFLLPSSSLLVTVSDTGLGIPLEEQSLVFDEFHQSTLTSARGYGGLGLGLAICRRLVELHGGVIGVRSPGESGVGSTFYFTLPVMESTVSLSEPAASPSAMKPVWVLIKSYEREAHLQQHLSKQGFEVRLLQVGPNTNWLPTLLAAPPGAILLDLPLASELGWEIMKVLKQNPTTQDVPVLFYSLAQEHNASSLLELDYMQKPLGPAELQQALARQGLLTTEVVQSKTILVVDDDPGMLELHVRVVQAQSDAYRVLKASNGREALTLMQQTPPDLVLLDLMMPELDGFGVLETMRQREPTRNIPVIVLTAQMLTEADMARLNQGVATVLQKGLFSAAETIAHIETVLGRYRKLGSEAQRLVRRAMAYMHEHYASPISPEILANRIGVSEGYLFRCFRQEMGLTVMVYLNRYRLNRAKDLLMITRKSITDIALEVGFSDSAHFSHVFHKEVGVSPEAYRREQDKPSHLTPDQKGLAKRPKA